MILVLVLSSLLVAASEAGNPLQPKSADALQVGSPEVCMALHCGLQVGACILNSVCFDTLQCMTDCKDRPDESQCQFNCEMTVGFGNEVFETLIRCMGENDCFPEVPPDGNCLASAADTVQEITDIAEVAGDWWVVRGVNCGQDSVWQGAYDWYPCQHARYVILDDGWVNNTTYCGGTDSVCTTDTIVTIPHATMPSPGLIQLDYDDAPLLPQVEKWHIVSYPEENYMMVFWCGTNPALNYNGGFVLSRTRTQDDMKPESEAEFRKVAASLGADYDAMCVTDNTACQDD